MFVAFLRTSGFEKKKKKKKKATQQNAQLNVYM